MNLFKHLNISTRVFILAGTGVMLLLLSGLVSLNGLNQSNAALRHLYQVGLSHTVQVDKVVSLIRNMETEMLLVLQHDPSSVLAQMHDHPMQHHIDEIEADLTRIDTLWSKVAASELTDEERAIVTRFQGVLQALRDGAWATFKLVLTQNDYRAANELVLVDMRRALGVAEENAAAMLSIQDQEAKQDYAEAEQRYDETVTMLLAVLAVAVVVSALVALAIRQAIAGAVGALDKAASEIAEGRLDMAVEYPGNDELRHVADAVDRIRRDFASTVSSLRDAVGQIASAAEQTSVISGQTRQGISSQRAETEQVATAMNEMNATVHDVAHNATSAAEAARAADESATHGRKVVRNAIDTIDRLAGDVASAGQVIERLQHDSEQIGGVLDVIRGIAEQTNLLALNAAIEAARAGEQGRGFAVVADEVRTLASRTQASTSEIHEMISRLQSGTGEAVAAMQAGSRQAAAGVEHAAEAGNALDSIIDAVDRISDMSTQIAAAVEEQSAVAEEINHNIHNITTVAGHTDQGAEQNAAAAADLARLANRLQEDVSRFRL